MEGGYDASNTVENQNVDNPEPQYPQELQNSEAIYHQQQQHLQHQTQNQSDADRPMEIPAAKVRKHFQYYLVLVHTFTQPVLYSNKMTIGLLFFAFVLRTENTYITC